MVQGGRSRRQKWRLGSWGCCVSTDTGRVPKHPGKNLGASGLWICWGGKPDWRFCLENLWGRWLSWSSSQHRTWFPPTSPMNRFVGEELHRADGDITRTSTAGGSLSLVGPLMLTRRLTAISASSRALIWSATLWGKLKRPENPLTEYSHSLRELPWQLTIVSSNTWEN